MTQLSDLDVQTHSDCLQGRRVDIVVSGSIAAVESIKFIRSLRRLGARVRVFMTRGASRFVGVDALSWASAQNAVTDFDPLVSHLAEADACIVAPCSAQFLSRLAHGYCDTASSALVQSYMGTQRPILAVATMHQSLALSPILESNMHLVCKRIHFLSPREEEFKNKFPDPDVLADQCANLINHRSKTALVMMGQSQLAVDNVRALVNTSSGGLGTALVTELYRYGYQVHTILGPCPIQPKVSHIHHVTSNKDYQSVLLELQKSLSWDFAFAAAALSDFELDPLSEGKISSRNEVVLKLRPSAKLLPLIQAQTLIAFKFDQELSRDRVQEYFEQYQLNTLVFNRIQDVTSSQHSAQIYRRVSNQDAIDKPIMISPCSKAEMARRLLAHVGVIP